MVRSLGSRYVVDQLSRSFEHTPRTPPSNRFSSKDRRPGDSPAKLRDLGLHRFQTYIRYQLAPRLLDSNSSNGGLGLLGHLIVFEAMVLPGLYDIVSMVRKGKKRRSHPSILFLVRTLTLTPLHQPSIGPWGAVTVIANLGLMGTFTALMIGKAFDLGAVVYVYACEGCRVPSFIAYPSTLVLTSVSGGATTSSLSPHRISNHTPQLTANTPLTLCTRQILFTAVSFGLYLVPTPAKLMDAGWHNSGDDTLDELKLINLKAGIITMANCAAVLIMWYK